MIIFKKANQLSNYIQQQKEQGKKIGLVPTMGALHNGHLTLIDTCRKFNDITVCSIFINPTQFNNPNDLKNYPVRTSKDIEQLISRDCSVLFLPAVDEMYPALLTQKQYGLGDIENRLEGFYRPGHFQGVCQAVDRLLQIVQPHNLYMGQKDYQQCMVIKKLLELTKREDDVKLVIVPTVRETDGLAMSSRNLRLSKEQRKLATSIYKELSFIKEHIHQQPFDGLKKVATEHLIQKGFKVDYVEIADAVDLTPAKDDTNRLVVLAAATTGEIRLIDNLILN
ncbi:MAG TPA: pantoate--beta-alanine ligase [Flavisolibacter sp.]|jgi:pantoate--beta-alanine ligase|nr:pantoate--beta-alanine ligase [Flavisolibacter sp.]